MKNEFERLQKTKYLPRKNITTYVEGGYCCQGSGICIIGSTQISNAYSATAEQGCGKDRTLLCVE